MKKPVAPCRRTLLITVAALLVTSVAFAQVNLSVAIVTPPPNPSVNVAGNYVVSVAGTTGTSGVYVTAIFVPAVTFNFGSSSAGACTVTFVAGDPSTTVTCPATNATTVTINATPFTSGTLSIAAGIIGNDADPDMTNNARTASVTVSGGGSVTVTGITPKAGASAGGKGVSITGTGFQAGATVTIGGTAATNVVVVTATQVTATTPAHAAGASTVTVTNPGNPPGSLLNGYTFMSPVVFVDDPLIQFSTLVKAQHILDLRSAIATVCSVGPPCSASWTDTVTPGVLIRALDVQEMRTTLNLALGNLGYSPSSYTDPTLQVGVTLIKKTHIDELRNRVKQVTN